MSRDRVLAAPIQIERVSGVAARRPRFASRGAVIAFVFATVSGCVQRPGPNEFRRCNPPADALDVFVELAPPSVPVVWIDGESITAWHDEIRVPAGAAFVLHFESLATGSRVAIPELGWAADVQRDERTAFGLCAGSVTPRGRRAIVINANGRRLPLEVVTQAAFERWRIAEEGGCEITSFRRPEESREVWRGRIYFESRGCGGCHGLVGNYAPSLRAMSERARALEDGTTRIADDAYFDDSIRYPARNVVAGYTAVRMPPHLDAPPNVGRYVRAYIESLTSRPE